MSGEESNTHSPLFSFSEYIFKCLETALDAGLTEFEFWDMTLEEVVRYVQSRKRVKKTQDQEKALFDYLHADLVGRSVARIYSSSTELPEIYEVYPDLFNKEEIEEARQQMKEEKALNYMMEFAASFNAKLNKEVAETGE